MKETTRTRPSREEVIEQDQTAQNQGIRAWFFLHLPRFSSAVSLFWAKISNMFSSDPDPGSNQDPANPMSRLQHNPNLSPPQEFERLKLAIEGGEQNVTALFQSVGDYFLGRKYTDGARAEAVACLSYASVLCENNSNSKELWKRIVNKLNPSEQVVAMDNALRHQRPQGLETINVLSTKAMDDLRTSNKSFAPDSQNARVFTKLLDVQEYVADRGGDDKMILTWMEEIAESHPELKLLAEAGATQAKEDQMSQAQRGVGWYS